jgi:hypothetical protein
MVGSTDETFTLGITYQGIISEETLPKQDLDEVRDYMKPDLD